MAWLYTQHMLGGLFSARDLVAMATRDAAAHPQVAQGGWARLPPGKRADMLVIAGKAGDPYEALIQAKETTIRLVMINGVARYGMPGFMGRLAPRARRYVWAARRVAYI